MMMRMITKLHLHTSVMRTRICFLLFAYAVILVGASAPVAHAETLQWSAPQPSLTFTAAQGKFRAWLDNPMVTISYGVSAREVDAQGNVLRVVACGSSVPAGTRVEYSFASHQREDIYWFGTGRASDSPYGDWSASEPPKNERCAPKNLYAARVRAANTVDLYGTLAVAPPSKTLSVSGASCTGSGSSRTCVLDQAGTVSATFTFAPTTGTFYGGFWEYKYPSPSPLCYGRDGMRGAGDAPMTRADKSPFVLSVPEQSYSCPLTVTASPTTPSTPTGGGGGEPSDPTLAAAGGSSCRVGSAYTLSMTAASPSARALRYLVDWDGDGTTDQLVPASGYVPSGTPESVSRTYATAGQKSVRVAVQDDAGALSRWVSFSFACTARSGEDEAQDGLDGTVGTVGTGDSTAPDLTLRAIPSLVRAGQQTRVSWSAQNVSSCVVTGTNGDSWETRSSRVGGEESSVIRRQVIYTLTCLTGSQTLRKSATVNVIPVFQEN